MEKEILTPEQAVVRLFASVLLHVPPPDFEGEKVQSFASIIADHPNQTYRLMIDVELTEHGGIPRLNVHQCMFGRALEGKETTLEDTSSD